MTSEQKGVTNMKKLISLLMALCLLCTAAAALAETPTWDSMPVVVSAEEDVELTDADFEGDWVVDKVFYDETFVPSERYAEFGISVAPMHIADGKVTITYTDENGTREEVRDYTLENNQLLAKDETGSEAVFEKLEDGNILMTLFVDGEGDEQICISFFMIHP